MDQNKTNLPSFIKKNKTSQNLWTLEFWSMVKGTMIYLTFYSGHMIVILHCRQ